MNVATSCPGAGPDLLAAKWQNPPSDSVTLDALAAASKRVKDARVANAALGVVQNRAASKSARTRALEVLVGQVGVYVTFGPIIQQGERNLATGEVKMVDLVSARRRAGVAFVEGAVPVSPAFRGQVTALLRNIEQQPDDLYVKLAAKRARELIELAK